MKSINLLYLSILLTLVFFSGCNSSNKKTSLNQNSIDLVPNIIDNQISDSNDTDDVVSDNSNFDINNTDVVPDTSVSDKNSSTNIDTPKQTASKPLFEDGKFGQIILSDHTRYEDIIAKDALFIDIRNNWEREYYGYAKGSRNSIDGYKLVYEIREPNGRGGYDDSQNNYEEFKQNLLKVVKNDKFRHIILICHSSGRTKRAAKALAEDGFRSVEHIVGGLNEWEDVGLPILYP